tara:strand:+ start:410 stop:904 length:495 start_codon:yes stop_codon:yes gene_type:complete
LCAALGDAKRQGYGLDIRRLCRDQFVGVLFGQVAHALIIKLNLIKFWWIVAEGTCPLYKWGDQHRAEPIDCRWCQPLTAISLKLGPTGLDIIQGAVTHHRVQFADFLDIVGMLVCGAVDMLRTNLRKSYLPRLPFTRDNEVVRHFGFKFCFLRFDGSFAAYSFN